MHLGSALDDVPLGERVDMGSMISGAAVDKAETMILYAEKQGATVLTGGRRFIHHKWKDGHYFQPTVYAFRRFSLVRRPSGL